LVDYPAFNWRGLHLDVSRHFFTVDEVKRYIDLMALYKFNMFHWHLTDDQGWRIEIKKYPKLTETGAFRDSTMIGHYSDQPRTFETETYGGFYTQDQIREVVQYAKERYITVIPEIEFPGHARAALAAYPELSCTGEQNGVPGTWGIFDDIFCSKRETIDFMKDVLGEVVELFPSEYFHIGGDEAPKTRWNKCPNCQKVIAENGLHDSHELQSYFIGQMDEFLTSKGKKLIGWDEILEGGLSPNAAVMSWRGTKGGIEAAKQKHEVVMTPTTYCYFDYYQSGHASEPIAIGGFLPLEKVYKFNPIPKGLSKSEETYILGGQANLWTEYIASMEHLEYMTYPRALALAQSVWCKEKPSYESFLDDFVNYQEDYLDRYKVNYARSIHQPKVEITRKEKGINVHFKGVGEDYHFTVSTKEIGGHSMSGGVAMGVADTLFFEQVEWGHEPKIIRTSVLDDSGRKSLETEFVVHSTLGAEIEMITKPHPKFNNNGSLNLVDGIKGSLPWKGNQWLGFDTSYVEFIVDLGSNRIIRSVELGFLDQNGSWIYLPDNVTVQVSKKLKWRGKKEFTADVDEAYRDVSIYKMGRYVRVMVRAMDIIPEGLEGGGNTPWTFIDEIQIR
jgi:hexosaminidase